MRQYFSRYWIIITISICGLFIAVFLPLSLKSIGAAKAVSYTLTGVAAIWIVYFIRAHILKGFEKETDDDDPEQVEEEESEVNSS